MGQFQGDSTGITAMETVGAQAQAKLLSELHGMDHEAFLEVFDDEK